MFNSAEWATWVAMIVFAYGQGGATEAGIVAAVQLVPSALFAPVAASIGDRYPPGRALLTAYAVQGLACGIGGAALVSDLPKNVVYALLIPATVSFTLTRPLHSAFAPALARSPEELTATNVASGWIVGISVFVAPAIAGVLLAVGSPGVVFFVMGCACADRCGARRSAAQPRCCSGRARRGVTPRSPRGLRAVGQDPTTRLLVALLAAQGILIGSLDVMYVELSQGVLGRGGSWAGYLNAAFGAGGVLAVLVTAKLVGRPRMGPPIAITVGVASAALLGIAAEPGVAGVVLMLVLVGGSLSTFDVAARTLLQRAAPDRSAGPGLRARRGSRGSHHRRRGPPGRGARRDRRRGALRRRSGSHSPARRRALRPAPARDRPPCRRPRGRDRAASLDVALRPAAAPDARGRWRAPCSRIEVPAGTVVIRQGDPGDLFYAIADGEVEVIRDGDRVAVLGRGDGFGELALLLDRPRNATVRTLTDSRLYTLSPDEFVPAVTGHPRAAQAGAELVRIRLEPEASLPDVGRTLSNSPLVPSAALRGASAHA